MCFYRKKIATIIVHHDVITGAASDVHQFTICWNDKADDIIVRVIDVNIRIAIAIFDAVR